MDSELIAILITNPTGGQVFYLPKEEWARLERDFENYLNYAHPTAGSYQHRLPETKPGGTPRGRLWRKLSGKTSKTGKLDLEFPGVSIISGQ